VPLSDEEYLKNPINGPLLLKDGSIYLGQSLNGKREGRGKLQGNDGSIFEGHWKNDMVNGFGRLIHPDGPVRW
jgi:hypothetical protein